MAKAREPKVFRSMDDLPLMLKGEEYIMFIGVSFDSAQLMNFELGELGEIEMDFTFDDFKYLKSIN